MVRIMMVQRFKLSCFCKIFRRSDSIILSVPIPAEIPLPFQPKLQGMNGKRIKNAFMFQIYVPFCALFGPSSAVQFIAHAMHGP